MFDGSVRQLSLFLMRGILHFIHLAPVIEVARRQMAPFKVFPCAMVLSVN